MKNLKSISAYLILGLLFYIPSFSQNYNTPRGMEDLIEMKGAYLDSEMQSRGFSFIATSKSGNDSYQNWYNSQKDECLSVRISDGRVKSIVKNSINFDCQSHQESSYGYNHKYNHKYNNNNNNNNSNNYSNRYNSNSYIVTVYRDKNFTGVNSELSPGYHNFRDLGVGNDQITSIKIPRGYSVTVYTEANFKGRSKTYTKDVAYLGDFNDRISSILVYKN
ncbi:hypothetical protein GFJ94_03870 [Flavobacterium sp. LMO8]|uniref:hypothetical protein n=1 Tax=Flavobacterium sp. LMO8 TaxID=2654244 RepID=UPI0012916462|nr:hypothetical protein [Flavobacterium sp. LMO8]MQP24199.1 hypothetical protein [Flavobacterium sp. LMO8]